MTKEVKRKIDHLISAHKQHQEKKNLNLPTLFFCLTFWASAVKYIVYGDKQIVD